MSGIQLTSQFHPEVTLLPNDFIDRYMPSANGTFVKVYIYLLRSSQCGGLSVTGIAEALDETEKDILRALRYWEDKKLLSLSMEASGELTGITILAPPSAKASVPPPIQNEEPAEAEDPFHRPKYSEAQIHQLKELGEVQFLLTAVEHYLDRLLKPGDIQLVLYLYEGLGFSSDLILHLYEYCISMNKKNNSYIESVALAWAKEGIDTVEKAEDASLLYSEAYQAVNKAFGLNRAPGNAEKQFLRRWIRTYGFTSRLIEEACNRTLLSTGKPDFKYTDKILANWHSRGVKTLTDVGKLDEEHVKRQTPAGSFTKPPVPAQPSPGNKFNAFPQRQYTQEDFDNLERRLLNKKN